MDGRDRLQRFAEQRTVEGPAVDVAPQRVGLAIVHDERVAIEHARDTERQRAAGYGSLVDDGGSTEPGTMSPPPDGLQNVSLTISCRSSCHVE